MYLLRHYLINQNILPCYLLTLGLVTYSCTRPTATPTSTTKSAVALASGDHSADVPEERLSSQRLYRELVMPNGLHVLLMSDPEVSNASAALNVNVGSFADPAEHQGLAHFTEHAIFLGSKKFPSTDVMFEVTSRNGGYSNAFTDINNTNYQFEISPDAFSEALEIFADGLTHPLMPAEALENEKNAITEEYERNTQDSSWRDFVMVKNAIKAPHPMSQNNIGNTITLKNTHKKEVEAFFKKYYTANNMKLALLAPHSLDELEKQVNTFFKDIPKNPMGSNKLTTTPMIINPRYINRLTHVKGLSENKDLSLVFVTPSAMMETNESPVTALQNAFNQFNDNDASLSKQLKKMGLVSNISLSAWDTPSGGLVLVDAELTDEGFTQPEQIAVAFFKYIEFLKNHPIPSYAYSDLNTINSQSRFYSELSQGAELTSLVAFNMETFKGVSAIESLTINEKSTANHQKLTNYLNTITKDNMFAFLTYQDAIERDREAILDIGYSIPNPGSRFVNNSQIHEVTLEKEFNYNQKNSFIPKDFSLVPSTENTNKAHYLINEPAAKILFHQASDLELPKTSISIEILSKANMSKKEILALELAAEVFNAKSLIWRQQASAAGYLTGIYANTSLPHVFNIDLNGFSEKAIEVLSRNLQSFKELSISDDELFSAKMILINREYENEAKATSGAATEVVDGLINPSPRVFWNVEETTLLIEEMTTTDILSTKNKALKEISLTGSATGNLSEAKLKEFFKALPELLGSTLTQSPILEPARVRIPGGKHLSVAKNGFIEGNAFLQWYDIKDGYRNRRLASILNSFISTPYFQTMRTEWQLGYEVYSWRYDFWDQQSGLAFLVVSSDHGPLDIQAKHQEWLALFSPEITKISDDDFTSLVENEVYQACEMPYISLSDYSQELEAILYYGNPIDYREKCADIVLSISKEEFQKLFFSLTNKAEIGSLTVQIFDPSVEEIPHLEGATYFDPHGSLEFTSLLN